jgi:hypothetical protein
MLVLPEPMLARAGPLPAGPGRRFEHHEDPVGKRGNHEEQEDVKK